MVGLLYIGSFSSLKVGVLQCIDIVAMNKADVTLIYPGHTLSALISQKGDLASFTGEAKLSYDGQDLWSKVKFTGTGPITLNLDISTPFTAVKKIAVTFDHTGSMMK